MAGATTPDGILFLTSGSSVDPVSESATQASSIQSALALRPFYQYIWNTASDKTNQTGMRSGDMAYEIDISTPFQYISSALGWQSIPFGSSRMLSGSVSITPTGSGSLYTGSSTVTFPTNFFPSTPNVFTNPYSASPQTVNSTSTTVTAASFVVKLSRTDNASATSVFWMAML